MCNYAFQSSDSAIHFHANPHLHYRAASTEKSPKMLSTSLFYSLFAFSMNISTFVLHSMKLAVLSSPGLDLHDQCRLVETNSDGSLPFVTLNIYVSQDKKGTSHLVSKNVKMKRKVIQGLVNIVYISISSWN